MRDGVLVDVFLIDRRNPTKGVIYFTASRSYSDRNGDGHDLIWLTAWAQAA